MEKKYFPKIFEKLKEVYVFTSCKYMKSILLFLNGFRVGASQVL